MTDAAIDLRSDTVTRPTLAMRAAMASAPVGDDQYGDDPSVNALQERVAALLGKEAALWLPTGTMANHVALKVFTRPGDDVVTSRESHAVWHEAGGSGANAGVQLSEIGDGGTFTLAEFLEIRKPIGHFLYPPTTLLEIENTHNRAGGVVFPQAEAERLCAEAARLGVHTYLDGARLWNAALATGRTLQDLAAPFELVMVALSKGLGAPGGSVLAGSREVIAQAVRYRRMLGGAMRQVGIFAAAGLYALEHHRARLSEDHANARLLAERLAECANVRLEPERVETNIVVFDLNEAAPISASELVGRAREQGVLVNAFSARRVRLVTHLDVSGTQCERATEVLLELLGTERAAGAR